MFKLNSTAKRPNLYTVCRTGSGYGGTIRGAGGKIGDRGGVLENDYFNKKVNNYIMTMRRTR